MSNPFRQKMPFGMDIRIRVRLLKAYLSDKPLLSAGMLLVPAFAAWLFFIGGTTTTPEQFDSEAFVLAVREAQAEELAAAEGGIYHVIREITEGSEKTAYVKEVLGEADEAPARTDRIVTYQHSDTALALIESNGTERSFEAFLSREHDDGLALHHFGPEDTEVPTQRGAYDTAHDLASLYTDYTSLERPAVPVLSEEATFVAVDQDADTATFRTVVNEAITIDAIIDMDSKLVVEEIIYVAGVDTEYEMTRVTYTDRQVIPADQFDIIFDPTQYDYSVVATREA